jgi:hypothetical protein
MRRLSLCTALFVATGFLVAVAPSAGADIPSYLDANVTLTVVSVTVETRHDFQPPPPQVTVNFVLRCDPRAARGGFEIAMSITQDDVRWSPVYHMHAGCGPYGAPVTFSYSFANLGDSYPDRRGGSDRIQPGRATLTYGGNVQYPPNTGDPSCSDNYCERYFQSEPESIRIRPAH